MEANLLHIKMSSDPIMEEYKLGNSLSKDEIKLLLEYIDKFDLNSLKNFAKEEKKFNVFDIITDGKTLLHYATIKNDESIVSYILNLAVLSLSIIRKKIHLNQIVKIGSIKEQKKKDLQQLISAQFQGISKYLMN